MKLKHIIGQLLYTREFSVLHNIQLSYVFVLLYFFYRNIDIYINTSIFLYFISVGEATSSSNGLIMRLISMGRQLLTNIPIVSVFQFPPNLFSNLSYLTKNLIRTIIIVYQKRSSTREMFPMATHLRLPTLLHLIMFLPIIVMRFYDYLAFIYLDQFSSTIIQYLQYLQLAFACGSPCMLLAAVRLCPSSRIKVTRCQTSLKSVRRLSRESTTGS